MGLSFLAYSSLPIMLGWSCWWLVSFVSTIYVTSGCDGQGNCSSEPPGILVFALLLSYHWTFQVIKNVIHVTVAGTVTVSKSIVMTSVVVQCVFNVNYTNKSFVVSLYRASVPA